MRNEIATEWFEQKLKEYVKEYGHVNKRELTKVMRRAQNGKTNHRTKWQEALKSLVSRGQFRYETHANKYFLVPEALNPFEQFVLGADLTKNPVVKKTYDEAMQQLHDKGEIDCSAFDINSIKSSFGQKDNLLDNFSRLKEKLVEGYVIAMLEKGMSEENVLKELAQLGKRACDFWKKNHKDFKY